MQAPHRITRALRVIRATALLFALATCLLAWSLLNRGEKLAQKAGSEQVERAVSATETDVNRTLVSLDMFLADMARWTQHMPADPAAHKTADAANRAGGTGLTSNTASLNLLLRAALNQNLQLRDVALLDASGTVLLSARASTPRLGLELPPGFLASVLDQPFPALLVSLPVANSQSSTHLLYMGRSVRLDNGAVAAMVAEVHGPLFSSMLDSGVADTALVVTFERGSGELLASFPPADSLSGTPLSPALDKLEADGTARPAQGRLAATDVLLAVRPTLYPGLSVSVSLPTSHVLADWHKDRLAILAVAAALLVLTALATLTAQRYMLHMAQAQATIAEANAQLQTSNIDIARTLSLVQATLEA
ncbi:MAG: hypothetical protein K2W33_06480, partial [Burkholderiales bacterium]|nr:hypothetical protein [Burkholderiales bacterium]